MLDDRVMKRLAEIVGAENVVTDAAALRLAAGSRLAAGVPLAPESLFGPRRVGREGIAPRSDGATGSTLPLADSPSVGTPRLPGYPAGSGRPRGLASGPGTNMALAAKPSSASPPRADAVVKPRSAEEVRQVVALAGDEGIAVTVRGGGTGIWGGAVPVRGGVVVSTENLAGEPEIHRDDLYVVAGAGTITGKLRGAVERAGLFYPVDPASEASSTVGGNVGEGARGLRSLKYGTTRNYVLGLELVTGEGKLVSVGAKTVKNVAGYDLTRLMVGSEGTLAIATSVTLRVLPLPPEEVVLAFALPDAATAARAAAEIMAQGLGPSLVEFADRESLRTVARNPWSDAGALLMVGFDGTKSRCEEQASKAKGILRSEYAVAPAADVRRPDCERVLTVRRAVLTGLLGSSRVVRLEGLSVSPARLARLVERISEISRSSGLGMAVWGHAGDGAIHVAVLGDPAVRDTDRNVKVAIGVLSDVAGVCEDLGGAACGGTGLRHGMPAARLAVTGVGLDVLKEIKRAMDPSGIMNPGKMNYDA